MLFKTRFQTKNSGTQYRTLWQCLHIDPYLLTSVLLLLSMGLLILYSAGNQNLQVMQQQLLHIGFALFIMILFAQITPTTYQRWAPWLYGLSLVLLVAVLIVGHIGKGAQRWLNLGILHLQPSEMMKLAIPMCLAWQCHKLHLPISGKTIWQACVIILIPVVLTAKQPDLGTAILLAVAGASVLFFAGLRFKVVAILSSVFVVFAPIAWHFMHTYQKQRVLTFFNPERDPLGTGYHIIQSKIAIGSGGFFGKGWLAGTQSHLHFLPEHSTDFIFAVCGEEFGFLGSIILIILFMLMIARGLYITMHAQDTFTRLLAGSLTLTTFVSFFINMGMVIGILPVVGIPLPLISYGGSSMVTFMASFGILMSIQMHRKLLTT
ncbi:rod shape-determining protein RodA [Gammaproteobacteria bacterium SCGC AG-212-F23]|nr:rod shape-determining protein RodA [Gammaproteobacteria bacterium SCGC AG-212-F23]